MNTFVRWVATVIAGALIGAALFAWDGYMGNEGGNAWVGAIMGGILGVFAFSWWDESRMDRLVVRMVPVASALIGAALLGWDGYTESGWGRVFTNAWLGALGLRK